MNSKPSLRVACLQMSSTANLEENLAFIDTQLSAAGADDIDLLALPENFAQMPKCQAELHVEPEFGVPRQQPVQGFLQRCAERYQLHIIAGTLPILVPGYEKPFARCLIVGPQGVVGQYDKLHLFDVDVPDDAVRLSDETAQRYRESDRYQAGELIQSLGQAHSLIIGKNAVRLGASICYDLRFPELFRAFAKQAANIISVPSAFTYETGRAHWEVLLRARAIENQAFVLAPAQVGEHASGRRTWGHSMIIDPWGRVLAENKQQPGLLSADLHLDHIDTLQKNFPVLRHRRIDV